MRRAPADPPAGRRRAETRRAARRRGRRPAGRGRWIFRLVGVLFILTGLVMVGYVSWQLWGTNYVSHKRQAATIENLRQAWRDGVPQVTSEHGTANAVVRIPAFGDDYAVPLLEGLTDDVLSTGFGHFTESAGPGEDGNFAIAAHRITHGEPLRRMPDLKPGDEVIIETAEREFVYVLDTGGDDLEVTFRDGWVVAPKPVNPDPNGVNPVDAPKLFTLTTCADLFHSDNRLVAFGHLVDVRPRQ